MRIKQAAIHFPSFHGKMQFFYVLHKENNKGGRNRLLSIEFTAFLRVKEDLPLVHYRFADLLLPKITIKTTIGKIATKSGKS